MKIDLASLSHFIGSEQYYQGSFPGCVMTEGVYHLVSRYSLSWMADLCFSYQVETRFREEYFQTWNFAYQPNSLDGKVVATDGNLVLLEGSFGSTTNELFWSDDLRFYDSVLAVQEFQSVEAVFESLSLFLVRADRHVLILPSEY